MRKQMSRRRWIHSWLFSGVGDTSSSRSPVVLRVRVLTGISSGPEKTILHSPSHAEPARLRISAAFIHPCKDHDINLIRQRATSLGCPLRMIGETGLLVARTVFILCRLC